MGKFISFPLSIFHHCNIFGIDAGSANIVWLGEERTYGAFIRRHDDACLCTLEKSGSEVTLGVQNIMGLHWQARSSPRETERACLVL